MEPTREYLRQSHIYKSINQKQPLCALSVGYYSCLVGGYVYAIALTILKGAGYFCVGGCELYSGDMIVSVAENWLQIGAVAGIFYAFKVEKDNEAKRELAIKCFDPTTEYVSRSRYESIIKILGKNISHHLDHEYHVLSDEDVEILSKKELENHNNFLSTIILDTSKNWVNIYSRFIVNERSSDSAAKFLRDNLTKDNADKIYQFAIANNMTPLPSFCEKYYKKNELENLKNILSAVVDGSENPVKIYRKFIVTQLSHRCASNYLIKNLTKDNVNRLSEFANANKMTTLINICKEYFNKELLKKNS